MYDAWNRLAKVFADTDENGEFDEEEDELAAEYRYDGRGRRIEKVLTEAAGQPGSVAYYHNHAWQVLEERFFDDEQELEHVYQNVWSPRYIDSLILRDACDPATGGILLPERLFYLSDANYNVTGVVCENPASPGEWHVVECYLYDPYGRVAVLNGDPTGDPDGLAAPNVYPEWSADPDGRSDLANTTLYTGRELDPESGLMYYRARYYDAGLSTFVARDPAKADINLYRYVRNNPVIYVDPTGLWSSGANGVYTHRAITRDAFNQAFPKTRGFENCAARIVDRLIAANEGQDAGSAPWPFSSPNDPGQQNVRHYCRDDGVSKAAADAAYTGYIAGEIATFRGAISGKNPTQANCDDALDAIGRLSHTWEDFYSHAIRNVLQGPGIGPPVFPINRDVLWGDGAPRLNIGDADHPGPDIVAPTFFYPSGGEHGLSEPSSRDLPNGLDRRRAAAVDFVAGRLRTLLLEWFNRCRCYCKD